jgi:hypothetical protein
MAIRKWYGAFVAGGLVGLIAAGCSSSNESAATDAGDGGYVRKMLDGAIGIGTGGDDASDAALVVDGTTGKACSSDSDCHPDGGAGVNVCSVDVGGTITGVMVQLWATPVCLVPPSGSPTQGNCDPVPTGMDDGLPHFCDGPDLPTSPGYCLPFDLNNPQPGQGTCYPLCTFVLDGSKPAGCVGTDTCLPISFVRDGTTGVVTGYGFCGGGCQQDSDCMGLGAGYVCQTDIGYCTKAKLTRTKAIGAACKAATTPGSPDDIACNCDSNPNTSMGVCANSCVVGGLPCAAGYICDAGFQNPIVFTSSSPGTAPISVPVTAQNTGIPGFCRPLCTLADAGVVAATDAGVDAGTAATPDDGGLASCPATTTCQKADVVGPDCVP